MNEPHNTLPALRGNLQELPLAPGKAVELQNIGNAFALAELVVKAGFAPKGSTVESAVVAMIHGSKLGLDPLSAVQGIAVVNGRPTLWGDQLAAAVKGSSVYGGEKVEYFNTKDSENYGVKFTTWRKGHEDELTVETFSVADAKRAGLWGKPGPWTQYPKRMLFHRARAFAYRDCFPDALAGMRFREEEMDNDDTPAAPDATPKPIRPGVPADQAGDTSRKRASKLRAALDISPDATVEDAEILEPPVQEPVPAEQPAAPAEPPADAPAEPQA